MRISVVLTVFNRGDSLMKALWSLNAQTRLPDEVVVTDDGSSEDILEPLREHADALRFSMTYVRQEDRGFRLAKCRNNAVRVASGDYLVFLDQDIVVTGGYINLHAEHARPGEFLVAYPVLLTQEQTGRLTLELVERGDYRTIISNDGLAKIRSQFRKDSFYRLMRMMIRRGNRPKVRGGALGIFRDDFVAVDGFDENYVGWGAEDDDLGRRLYRAGITGRTVFLHDFPIHLWHPHPAGGEDSVNLDYYNRRLKVIARGDYRAVNGLSNPLGDDVAEVARIE